MTTRSSLRRPRSVYIEYLEKRIAPATFVVANLNDSGPGSLRDAVEKANAARGADTIVFRGDATEGEISLSSGEIDITDSLNIKGPGTGSLSIDAQKLSRIFNINDGTAAVKKVTISGLNMVDGNSGAGNPGGAIQSRESLTLTKSVISGCVASSGGGAIYIDTRGKLIVRDSKLTGNSDELRGGAILAFVQGGVQILSTLIAHNSTSGDGGGMLLVIGETATGDIVISGSQIIQNSGTYGGGLWVENLQQAGGKTVGKITINNSVVANNDASTAGGGMFLSDGNVLIERTLVANNTAVRTGGGASGYTIESLTIRGSEFFNNRTIAATPYISRGGAIYINGSKETVIQRTLVSDNTSFSGGGIAAIETKLTLQDSTITGNTASSDGGGIYAFGGTINVLNSAIQDNQASYSGGGVSVSRASGSRTDLRIVDSLVSGNRSGEAGGGVIAGGDGRVEIANSRFLDNAAEFGGGGVYLFSNISRISIANSVFSKNTSEGVGGGMVLRAGAADVTVSIARTLVADNVASGNGGGIYIGGSTGSFTITNSVIRDNVAKEVGGGIWTGPTLTLIGSRATGNIASESPQIFEQVSG